MHNTGKYTGNSCAFVHLCVALLPYLNFSPLYFLRTANVDTEGSQAKKEHNTGRIIAVSPCQLSASPPAHQACVSLQIDASERVTRFTSLYSARAPLRFEKHRGWPPAYGCTAAWNTLQEIGGRELRIRLWQRRFARDGSAGSLFARMGGAGDSQGQLRFDPTRRRSAGMAQATLHARAVAPDSGGCPDNRIQSAPRSRTSTGSVNGE